MKKNKYMTEYLKSTAQDLKEQPSLSVEEMLRQTREQMGLPHPPEKPEKPKAIDLREEGISPEDVMKSLPKGYKITSVTDPRDNPQQKKGLSDIDMRNLVEAHQKALKNILEQAKMMPEIDQGALKLISERANTPLEKMTRDYEKFRGLNLEYLFEYLERTLKTSLTQPKLSQEEMMRQAQEQMNLDPQRKSREKNASD